MGVLEKNLPKIVKKALKKEDGITESLVNVLLNEVYQRQGSSSLQSIVFRVLDTEIEKQIDAGLIDINVLQGDC